MSATPSVFGRITAQLPIVSPLLASLLLVVSWTGIGSGVLFSILLTVALIGSVMAAVHHAEVVAHRVGEPFGTLILALAVTAIEVALIVSLMVGGGGETKTLARDTVFAAVMLILTGMVGLCLVAGGSRFREQTFVLPGVNAALTTLTAIVVLTLILPNYTSSAPGPAYSPSQLIFIALISLVLYGTFILVQTVRHRDYFLPVEAAGDEDVHAPPPSWRVAGTSLGFLTLGLVVVVLLAKKLSPTIEAGVVAMGAPTALVGIIIAAVVLLPEGLAAFQAARRNRLQTSLNLALGSALAGLGLTIPAVAITSLALGITVSLGIDLKSTVLLLLSLFVTVLSLSTGRTTVLPGVVLLVIGAVYLFTTVVP